MVCGPVVDDNDGRCEFEVVFQDFAHGFGDAEISDGGAAEEALVPSGEAHEGVEGAEFEGEERVAKVVPVDYQFGIAEPGDCGSDGEGGD
jgi:hypothetical protein